MSFLTVTKTTTPNTPAANKSIMFVDTADRRFKQIDDNGAISIFNNDGLQDRNILTNGGFQIQQRVATASAAIAGVTTSTRAGQVADRWAVTASVASNLNWAQIDTNGAQDTALQSRYYGSIISSTAGKKVMLSQFILGAEMAHLRGLKVRVSIKHNQKVGSGQTYRLGLLQLNASGTVDVCPAFLTGGWSTTTGVDPAWGTNLAVIAPDASPTGENCTVGASWATVTSQATTWVRSSAVFTVPTSAKNLCVVFFSDATGGTTDNISVAEFQLTQGPDVVDYVEPPQAETLIRCQRFFCKSFPLNVVPAASLSEATAGSGATGMIGKAGATALAANYSIQFPVQMWKVPTVTYFTPTASGAQCWRFSGAAAAAQTATASRSNSVTDRGVVVTATGDASGTVGDLVGVHYTADAEFIT
jgi:hypothetical protein